MYFGNLHYFRFRLVNYISLFIWLFMRCQILIFHTCLVICFLHPNLSVNNFVFVDRGMDMYLPVIFVRSIVLYLYRNYIRYMRENFIFVVANLYRLFLYFLSFHFLLSLVMSLVELLAVG